jgi:hypothetical protein
MHRDVLFLGLAAALAWTHAVHAENSAPATPLNEQAAKAAEWDPPQAVIDHIAYLEELEERFAGATERDLEAIYRLEGQRAALLYCKAIGFAGPCTIDVHDSGQFRASSAAEVRNTATPWWSWLTESAFYDIGVIANGDCFRIPNAPVQPVVIHMDDEDRDNRNARKGWIGSTVSDTNTTWRFCRAIGRDYRALEPRSEDYDYAVLKLGAICPPGARTIKRWQDNQDGNNQNWSSGNVYPNVNANGRNWVTFYCYFEGGARNVFTPGWMSAFPSLGYSHGVFASEFMPRQYALDYGWVYQDDEDFLNVNRWRPGPPRNDQLMRGGYDTWRGLIRVE